LNSTVAAKKQLTIRTIPWIFILTTLIVICTFFTFWSYGQLNVWAVLILLGVIALMAYFGEYASIMLDSDRRMASFERIRIWRRTKREIPFDDFHTISVEETKNQNSDGNSSNFRILFVLKTGESFSQTNFTSGSKASMAKTVQKIVDLINQGDPGVVAALDGVVRLKRDGINNGISWQVEFVANNDRPMLTRWKTDFGQFLDGVLLVTPNVGGMKMQTAGGKLPQAGWEMTLLTTKAPAVAAPTRPQIQRCRMCAQMLTPLQRM
jgi:Ca2+/Na+ antiporter